MPAPVKIGTITLEQPRKVRKSYDCAAWFRCLDLGPGTFDLTMTFTPEHWPQFVLFEQEGVVTESNFDALWCGVVIVPNRNKDVGERDTYVQNVYPYALSKLKIGKVNLSPEWEWLLLDSSEWHPHVQRLRVVAEMRSHGFHIVKVEHHGQDFTVTVDENGTQEALCFHVNSEWHLIHSDCSGDLDLGDIREREFWGAMSRFRHKQPV